MDFSRIKSPVYRDKVMSAEQAASYIKDKMTLSVPHFICYDSPVSTAQALLDRVKAGEKISVNLISAASCTPVIDEEWTKAGMIKSFMPYTQAHSSVRKSANAPYGGLNFMDYRLSVIPEYIRSGYLGDIDIALVSVAGITEDGKLKPSICSGYTQTVLNCAKKVILEINLQSSEDMYKLHDVFEPGGRPNRKPIPITKATDVIGSHFYHCDPEKVLGVVITDTPLYLSPMWYPLTAEAAPEEVKQIARNYVDFLLKEVKEGRMSEKLPPIQTGGGMVAGTVLREMGKHFKGMEMYTEAVLEDAVAMVREGSMDFISTAGFGCSGETTADILDHPDEYEGKLLIRPVEISNHPEVIRRLGLITMNNIVEADIYGNINSSHVNGTNVISGIGGALDFAQNAGLPSYFTLSTAKKGSVSCIVPSCSHIDITEHEASIIVTEYGVADLRNKSPKQRTKEMIHIAHPDYRPLLRDYYKCALNVCGPNNAHTPVILEELGNWHIRSRDNGTMLSKMP